jgi:hypothetical protein
VPLADADVVHRAWGLSAKVAERLQDALGRLTPDRLGRLFPQPNVRVVHVFAGVHVEAVPGNCVLPDIRDHLRVIVPGATQYHPLKKAHLRHLATALGPPWPRAQRTRGTPRPLPSGAASHLDLFERPASFQLGAGHGPRRKNAEGRPSC